MPGGLYWTVAVPAADVRVDLDAARAAVHVTDLTTRDYHTHLNDNEHGPFDPVTASFAVDWRGRLGRSTLRNPSQGFAGTYIEDTATVWWSAREADLAFVSDPASTSRSRFAAIGHERNGVFFPQGSRGE